MKTALRSGLLPADVLVCLFAAGPYFIDNAPLRIATGALMLLFLPGYALALCIFPKKRPVTGAERIALSLGLSIVIVPLLGFALNFTSLGITESSMVPAVAAFVILASIFALLRQGRLPEADRFAIGLRRPTWNAGRQEKAVTLVLVIGVVAAAGLLARALITPGAEEGFTEFYVLGRDGEAAAYPREMLVGQKGEVTLGLVNHEQQPTGYRVEIKTAADTSEVSTPVLDDGQEWRQVVDFTPDVAGNQQMVEFILYKGDVTEPYQQPLYLWIDVKGQ